MFSFSSPQTIHFGRSQSGKAPELARSFGADVLIVHGASAARAAWLLEACAQDGLRTRTVGCAREPRLEDLEDALAALRARAPDVVLALGGGSVMDFAKALAALIPCEGPALEYLEIVGTGRGLEHAPIPMIALPTTAGTGAEVTKNAVIKVAAQGRKVSLRDPRMIPDVAIVDAGLMQGAPARIALAAGLDALTQVIEPYLCLKANPLTDALCVAAIPQALGALRALVEDDAEQAWDAMAWVSTCGGLALANAGLGAVHGFAGVIGGVSDAPHGEICAALLPAVLNAHLAMAEPGSEVARRLAWVRGQCDAHFGAVAGGDGIAGLAQWSRGLGLRGLRAMGVSDADNAEIARDSARSSSMKGNPFVLSQASLEDILRAAS